MTIPAMIGVDRPLDPVLPAAGDEFELAAPVSRLPEFARVVAGPLWGNCVLVYLGAVGVVNPLNPKVGNASAFATSHDRALVGQDLLVSVGLY